MALPGWWANAVGFFGVFVAFVAIFMMGYWGKKINRYFEAPDEKLDLRVEFYTYLIMLILLIVLGILFPPMAIYWAFPAVIFFFLLTLFLLIGRIGLWDNFPEYKEDGNFEIPEPLDVLDQAKYLIYFEQDLAVLTCLNADKHTHIPYIMNLADNSELKEKIKELSQNMPQDRVIHWPETK